MITWHFTGDEGWQAVTRDENGFNLPKQYSPWSKLRIIEIYEGKEGDREAYEAVQAQGYYLFRGKNA